MRKKTVNYSIYIITDPLLSRGRSSREIIEMAISGGASIVQYRDKRGLSTRSMIQEALEIMTVTKAAKVPLIINDRLDIALAVKADGIHLGQEDLMVNVARKYLGASKIIGVSVRSDDEAEKAIADGADYLAVSGIFPSTTKLDVGRPLGLEMLKKICRCSSIPVIGIGGINTGNAGAVIQAGATGVAVISAAVAAKDPSAAVRSLRLAVHSARNIQ
ncbi:thiamine phosphate synthase [bacterium]|nr:thiamine phosphate synthase [candidate division CSSED10-310 bacterium]